MSYDTTDFVSCNCNYILETDLITHIATLSHNYPFYTVMTLVWTQNLSFRSLEKYFTQEWKLPNLYFCFDLLLQGGSASDRVRMLTGAICPCETHSKRCFNIKTFTIGEAVHPLSGWISGWQRLLNISGNGSCANMK